MPDPKKLEKVKFENGNLDQTYPFPTVEFGSNIHSQSPINLRALANEELRK